MSFRLSSLREHWDQILLRIHSPEVFESPVNRNLYNVDNGDRQDVENYVGGASCVDIWAHVIIPDWDRRIRLPATRDLWRRGVPTALRGHVWTKAIGNELRLSEDDFVRMLASEHRAVVGILDMATDLPRTHFDGRGPKTESLKHVLEATVACHPRIGYVQGMSYLAAMLMMHLGPADSFICFSNLLSSRYLGQFMRMELREVTRRWKVYETLLSEELPRLFEHFQDVECTPEMYLLDWWFTVFGKAVRFAIAVRLWDCFLLEGEPFMFRASIGIVKYFYRQLMRGTREECCQLLHQLPKDIDESSFLDCIFGLEFQDERVVQLLNSS